MVALKAGDQAKSRLSSIPARWRRELATAMAADTLQALAAALDHVLVVGDGPDLLGEVLGSRLEIEQIAEPHASGLNAALGHGAALLQERGATVVVACVGDLPALRAASVRRVLEAAQPYPRSFLADASGSGTTMLVARNTDLAPQFGGSSAATHLSSGAHPLIGPALGTVADARTDVDTEADLVVASRIGLGPATRAVLARSGWQPPSPLKTA